MPSSTQPSSRSLGMTFELRAGDVIVTEDTLTAELSDGRTLSVPLDWGLQLMHGTEKRWRTASPGCLSESGDTSCT